MDEVPGPLVGPAEMQIMFGGVSRTRVKHLTMRPTFPAPFQKLIGTTVWLRADVEAWIAKYRPNQAKAHEDDEQP